MPGVNLPRNFNAESYKRSARKFANQLPQRDNCDLADPKEMFLWMLVALPGQNGGAQAFPSSYNMLVSEHLFECGAMLQCENCGHTKDPEKAYVPVAAKDPHWMTSPGKWVPSTEKPADTGDQLDAVLDGMPNQMLAALFQRLLKKHQDGVL